MKLLEISEASLAHVKARWMEEIPIGAEIVKADYQQIFDRIAKGSSYGPLKDRCNESVFYKVVDEGEAPWGLVEIIQTRSGSSLWIKMIDIVLAPSLELNWDASSAADHEKRYGVFSCALIGIFELTKENARADTIKVYGRSDAIYRFLDGFKEHFSDEIVSMGAKQSLSVAFEGRWLSFRALS